MNLRVIYFLVIVVIISLKIDYVYAKEYKSLKNFQHQTGLVELTASDWLKSDRKQNTHVWHKANMYNIKNQLPEEYITIVQRRDFYEWLFLELCERDSEVVWPKMAYYISKKLRLIQAFPFSIFTKKQVKQYARRGSETVFNNAFEFISDLIYSNKVFLGSQALKWDKIIIEKEQYIWLSEIYSNVDKQTLRTLTKMAKGKGFYTFLVPREIKFKGNLTSSSDRCNYALETLKPYCKKHYN